MSSPEADDLVAWARLAQAVNPHSLRVFTSKTEEEFIDAVEGALLNAIMQLESGRKEYWSLDELGLSKLVSRDLASAFIPATAEEHTNGHVDITVKHPNGKPYRYLGECKIWQSVPYHLKGMSQLLDDYSTGRHRRGCCLEFVRIADTAGKIQAIRAHLDEHRPLEQEGRSLDHGSIKSGFVTIHRHASGWDVEILHFGCNLHDPKSFRPKKKTGALAPRRGRTAPDSSGP